MVETYHKLKKNEISRLTDTAKDFFHLLPEFAKVNNLSNIMMVVLVDDKIQEIYLDTWAYFSSISIKIYLSLMKIVRF